MSNLRIQQWSLMNDLKEQREINEVDIPKRAEALGGLIWLYFNPSSDLHLRFEEDDEMQTLRDHILYLTFKTPKFAGRMRI